MGFAAPPPMGDGLAGLAGRPPALTRRAGAGARAGEGAEHAQRHQLPRNSDDVPGFAYTGAGAE